MLFIYYPKCSTCKNAKKYLEEAHVSFDERDIKENNPTYEELKKWYEMSNLPLKRFFNASGLLYKEMNLKDKLSTMSEEEQLLLLSSNGMLVKRPVLILKEDVIVGFDKRQYDKFFLNEDK